MRSMMINTAKSGNVLNVMLLSNEAAARLLANNDHKRSHYLDLTQKIANFDSHQPFSANEVVSILLQ
jgi:hypothetical protein